MSFGVKWVKPTHFLDVPLGGLSLSFSLSLLPFFLSLALNHYLSFSISPHSLIQNISLIFLMQQRREDKKVDTGMVEELEE